FGGKSLLVLARDSSVKLDHRLATLNRRIRSAGNNNARLDETFPRIRTGETIDAEAAWGKKQIANRVRRLHRRNDSELRKARNVGWVDNLRVLDAPTWISNLSFRHWHSLERRLVLVEYKTIRAIADRMRFDLNAFLQSVDEHRSQVFGFESEEAGSVGRV